MIRRDSVTLETESELVVDHKTSAVETTFCPIIYSDTYGLSLFFKTLRSTSTSARV